MINKSFFFIVVIFLLWCGVTGANENDSLLNVVNTSKDENDRIHAYYSLSYNMMWQNLDSAGVMLDSLATWVNKKGSHENKARLISLKGTYFWFKGNLDTAMYFYRKAHRYSEINNIESQYQKAVSNMGSLFASRSELDSAMKYLSEAMAFAKAKSDKKVLAKTYLDLANVYGIKDFNHIALDYLLQAEKIMEEMNDTLRLSFLYHALGNTYQGIGDFEKSRYYSFKALRFCAALNQNYRMPDIYNNIGVCQWLVKRDLDSARYYILKSMESKSSQENLSAYITNYVNLGGIEIDDGNYYKALDYLSKAKQLSNNYDDQYQKAALMINFGIAFRGLNRFDSARSYTNAGIAMAKYVGAYKLLQNGAGNLYMIDSIQGNYQSALENYKDFKRYTDSISNENVRNKIAELEIIHETEKKDRENKLLMDQNLISEDVIKKQKLIVVIIVSALVVIVFFLGKIFFDGRKLRLINQRLEEKNKQLIESKEEIATQNQTLEKHKSELEQLNETKDKFFSIVAHDLKGPFNALLGFLDMLEHEFDSMGDDDKLEIIQTLHKSSQNTYNQLVNLLDWSRSQRGLIKSKPKNINLFECTEAVIDLLRPKAKKKNHTLINNIQKDAFAFADENLTKHILINLINNAIKFTKPEGKIEVSAEKSINHHRVCVRDNGIGIPEHSFEQIFRINSDFNRQGTEMELGTGLGLVICKEFVALMNGTIEVQSRINQGSTFCFTLPSEASYIFSAQT